MSSIINSGKKFKSDIMKMMTNGTSNDVKIVLEDGEIQANKDVLCARSDFFATMLSNAKFIEGETKHVSFNHCLYETAGALLFRSLEESGADDHARA